MVFDTVIFEACPNSSDSESNKHCNMFNLLQIKIKKQIEKSISVIFKSESFDE